MPGKIMRLESNLSNSKGNNYPRSLGEKAPVIGNLQTSNFFKLDTRNCFAVKCVWMQRKLKMDLITSNKSCCRVFKSWQNHQYQQEGFMFIAYKHRYCFISE